MVGEQKALLLAGGGFKTIGYLGVLESAWPRLRPDLGGICGVSAGAMMGLLLAVGFEPEELKRKMLATNWAPILREVLCDLPVQRLLSGDGGIGPPCSSSPIRTLLQGWLDEKRVPSGATFEWLAARGGPAFACIVACLGTGKLLQLDATSAPRCSLLRAVLASGAVPFVFPPVRVHGELCVDAGVVNNVPVSVMQAAWPQWKKLLVLAPHAESGMPEAPWAMIMWHRANFMVQAELCRCRGPDVQVLRLPLTPGDVHVFSPGRSMRLLLWQGRLTLLCHENRAHVTGLMVMAVARLLRPRYRGVHLRKARA